MSIMSMRTVPTDTRDIIFALVIGATELFAMLVCIVLLYGNRHETHRKTKYGNVYSWMVVSNIIALVGDSVAWLFEGRPECKTLIFAANVISIVMALVMLAQFSVYIVEYLRERTEVSDKLLRANLIFYSVVIGVTLIACFCGFMFKLENGVFVALPFYGVYSVASLLGILFCLFTVIHYRKALGTHDSIAAYVYIALPTIGALINMYLDDLLSVTYQLTTLSLLVLYVMIQSEQGNRMLEEQRISTYYAEHDELTGLFSRRAYMAKLLELKDSDKDIGVIFCDMNGLKYTNDNFGHEKGDEMICLFADLLRKYFGQSGIYRISGDEFVIVLEQTDKNSFEKKAEGLEQLLCGQEQALACTGGDYGPAKDFEKMIRNAETIMYSRKEEFYKNHPELRRHQQTDKL